MRHLLAAQRLLLRSICLAVLLSSIPVWLVAGSGWAPIDPNELAMKGDPLAPGAAAIILYRQVDRDDNGSGDIIVSAPILSPKTGEKDGAPDVSAIFVGKTKCPTQAKQA